MIRQRIQLELVVNPWGKKRNSALYLQNAFKPSAIASTAPRGSPADCAKPKIAMMRRHFPCPDRDLGPFRPSVAPTFLD